MWPQALQMTRDECRGILRRLELESYSHVISVFRAQGGLTDNKAKLLEELRGIFHISQERHRAEARRVANDEQLCTIAEAISGPNTWQEWSREGRRSYPMLPRVSPQTALALIANNVATETASENAKLPYPADTAAAAAAEQANADNAIAGRECVSHWEIKREVYVVTDDPFKMPDIPAGNKKNLKRNISDGHTSSNKKRFISDSSPSKQQQHQKQFHHITANSSQATSPSSGASNIRKLYHNHNSKTVQNRLNQPQMQKQKLATKKSVVATGASTALPVTPGKRQATPAKSGRKSHSKIQDQKQQQQLLQQHTLAQQQQLLPQTPVRNILHVVGEGTEELHNEQKYAQPQIAASKKDITKNLSKLQLPNVTTSPTANATSPTVIAPLTASNAPLDAAHQMSAVISPSIGSGGIGGATIPSTMIHGKLEKQLISTPVQKIILEDRLPPHQSPGSIASSAATSTAAAVVVSTASTLQMQSTSTPQIMTRPQISAAANKLRAVNTTILPPGAKLGTKKLSTSTLISASGNENHSVVVTASSMNVSNASQSQVFSIIEGGSPGNTQHMPAVPTHTPPAVIQLQSTNSAGMTNEGGAAMPVTQTQPAQGKVLTTKLLPIVLSGASAAGAGGSAAGGLGGNTVNITKIETLNNGATLVSTGGGSGLSGVGSSNPNVSLKSMGSTLLLSPNQSSGTAGSTLFSTLTSGASVFRKSQIIKAGTIGVNTSCVGKLSGTFSTSNSGPQIISNIKLTPAITTTSIASISNQQQQSTTASTFLQHQLKNISTTGIRTSVKICQSSNGKVFIQPANKDASVAKGKLTHKILPNAVVSSSTTGGGTSATHQPQRIAIQKVQIIPAPLNSTGTLTGPFHTTSTQPQSQAKSIATTLSGSKGNMNMVFMPSVSGRTTSGTITLSKGSSIASGIVASKVQQAAPNQDVGKPNVVIIGSSPAQSGASTPIKTTTFIDGSNKYNVATPLVSSAGSSAMHLEPIQMITEDTPVDILNMPIIVDSGDGTNITMGNNIGDTVTVLPTSLVESAEQQQKQDQQAQPSTIILGATDWEMELDQATAVAAATKAAARSEYQRQSSGHSVSRQRHSLGDSQKSDQSIDGETIIIDDSFEDVIVEEQEEGDTDAGAETEGTVDGDIDGVETGEETGGEEGQEMTEKAFTIFSGNESEGEVLAKHQRGALKLKVRRFENAYNNTIATTSVAGANDDDEPIEVIDDEDDNDSQKAPSEKGIREVNIATNVNNGSSNNNSTTVKRASDAGFDETIVADIDENTAIEYIEEDSTLPVAHAVHMHEKCKINDIVNIASTAATERKFVDKEVMVLDDNDSAALTATAMLTAAPVAVEEDDVIVVDSDTSKVVSGSASTTSNAVAPKPAAVTTIKSSEAAGLH